MTSARVKVQGTHSIVDRYVTRVNSFSSKRVRNFERETRFPVLQSETCNSQALHRLQR